MSYRTYCSTDPVQVESSVFPLQDPLESIHSSLVEVAGSYTRAKHSIHHLVEMPVLSLPLESRYITSLITETQNSLRFRGKVPKECRIKNQWMIAVIIDRFAGQWDFGIVIVVEDRTTLLK